MTQEQKSEFDPQGAFSPQFAADEKTSPPFSAPVPDPTKGEPPATDDLPKTDDDGFDDADSEFDLSDDGDASDVPPSSLTVTEQVMPLEDEEARQAREDAEREAAARAAAMHAEAVHGMVRGMQPPPEYVDQWMRERMAGPASVPGAAPGAATRDTIAELLTQVYLLRNALAAVAQRWPGGYMRIDASDMRVAALHRVEISREESGALLLARQRVTDPEPTLSIITREMTGDPMDPPEQLSRRERERLGFSAQAQRRFAAPGVSLPAGRVL